MTLTLRSELFLQGSETYTLTASQLSCSQLLQGFKDEACNPLTLFSLVMGGALARFVELGCLRSFSSFSLSRLSVFAPKLASLSGVVVEGGAFAGIPMLAGEGSPSEFEIGTAHGALVIGLCRVVGKYTHSNMIVGAIAQDCMVMSVDYTFEVAHLREKQQFCFAERWVHARAVAFQMQISGEICHLIPSARMNRACFEVNKEVYKNNFVIPAKGGIPLLTLGEQFAAVGNIDLSAAFLPETKLEPHQRPQLSFSMGTGSKSRAFVALERFLGVAGSEPTEPQRLVMKSASELLDLVPQDEVYFERHPDRLAMCSLAYRRAATIERASSTEVTGFLSYIELISLTQGSPHPRDFLTGEAAKLIDNHYFNAFPVLKSYFLACREFCHDFMLYIQRLDPDLKGRDLKKEAHELNRVCLFLFAIREQTFDREVFDESSLHVLMTISEERLISTLAEIRPTQFIEDLAMFFDSLSRRMAANDALQTAQLSKVITAHLPRADLYRLGRKEGVSWREIEKIRKKALQKAGLLKGSSNKPTLLIGGIGMEWDQVVKYAEEGYNLVLVDPHPLVHEFFTVTKVADLETLRTRCRVSIEYVPEMIQSARLVQLYRGKIDSIELHNIKDNIRPEGVFAVEALLKEGGVLVYYNPDPIHDQLFDEQAYSMLLRKVNIPLILETATGRLVTPLGNHLLILQKTKGASYVCRRGKIQYLRLASRTLQDLWNSSELQFSLFEGIQQAQKKIFDNSVEALDLLGSEFSQRERMAQFLFGPLPYQAPFDSPLQLVEAVRGLSLRDGLPPQSTPIRGVTDNFFRSIIHVSTIEGMQRVLGIYRGLYPESDVSAASHSVILRCRLFGEIDYQLLIQVVQ